MIRDTDLDCQNATSSAYSSLTNSSGELSSNEGKIGFCFNFDVKICHNLVLSVE